MVYKQRQSSSCPLHHALTIACYLSAAANNFASGFIVGFPSHSPRQHQRCGLDEAPTSLHAVSETTTTKTTTTSSSRRDAVLRIAGGILLPGISIIAPSSPSLAAETIGKADDCNDSFCLGVWDGLLADCPHNNLGASAKLLKTGGAGCVCSQDDTPGIFSEPWDYSEAPNNSLDWKDQMDVLIPAIEFVSSRRGDTVRIEQEEGRYLRVKFVDKATGESSIGEFYFTPNDTTVQYRIASASGGVRLGSLKNMERAELIRKQLRYLKIPVLRNRSRSLFFGESDLDTFGPGSAMLGPPAEMTTGELEGGRGSDNADPKLKIDLVQKFPFSAS